MRFLNLENDFQIIDSWAKKFGLELKKEDLPRFGYISDTAALFVMTTNSNTWLIEPIIVDKDADKRQRHSELVYLMKKAFEHGKNSGVKRFWGLCFNEGSLKKALHYGFRYKRQPIFVELEV